MFYVKFTLKKPFRSFIHVENLKRDNLVQFNSQTNTFASAQ